jgi:hypothetical protein
MSNTKERQIDSSKQSAGKLEDLLRLDRSVSCRLVLMLFLACRRLACFFGSSLQASLRPRKPVNMIPRAREPFGRIGLVGGPRATAKD